MFSALGNKVRTHSDLMQRGLRKKIPKSIQSTQNKQQEQDGS